MNKYLFKFIYKHRKFIKFSIIIFPPLLFVLINNILINLQNTEILIFIFCAFNFYLISFSILREIVGIIKTRYIGRFAILNIITQLNRSNPKGLIGAEIGVFRGVYAKQIIDHEFIGRKLNIEKLYLIDPWKNYEEYSDANETWSKTQDFENAFGKSGNFQQFFYVYDRYNKKCSRSSCTGKIKKVMIANRSSFYCDKCQI